jgi:hypothetical protein
MQLKLVVVFGNLESQVMKALNRLIKVVNWNLLLLHWHFQRKVIHSCLVCIQFSLSPLTALPPKAGELDTGKIKSNVEQQIRSVATTVGFWK